MRAKLSLMGMYDYDNSILDNIQYVDEWTEAEKALFRMRLLVKTEPFEVLYPEPDTMKQCIGFWFQAHHDNFEKLYKTTVLEYNPIWNKDGTVKETEGINETEAEGIQRNRHEIVDDNRTLHNGYQSEEKTTGSNSEEGSASENYQYEDGNKGSVDGDHYVFSYDSDTAHEDEKSHEEHGDNNSGSHNQSNSRKNSGQSAGSDDISGSSDGSDILKGDRQEGELTARNNARENARTLTRIEQGNIGITTTQQMINEEREVDKFNLMDYIIKEFTHEFCIMCY